MEQVILISLPLEDLKSILRDIIREELHQINREIQPEEKLYSTDEACNLFQPPISRQTLYNWDKQGLVKYTTAGKRKRYKYSDIIDADKRIKRYVRKEIPLKNLNTYKRSDT